MNSTETRLPRTAPDYALRLEARAVRAEAQLAAVDEHLTRLRCYLTSSKFAGFDPRDGASNSRVEVQDVLSRLSEMTSDMCDAEYSAR